ncbi:hypothetical protein EC991_005412 [Linnemannia zychae]|nr:hypothetical protein EC991_005412 [Linnemannia zychae]
MSLAHLFSAANSSGLGNYTYAEAVTHERHLHPAAAPKKHRRVIHKQPSLRSRQSLGRSYGHRGHHPQHDLNPVEGPQYDISGPPRQTHHKTTEQLILPVAWFAESLSIHIPGKSTALAAPISHEEEAAVRRHIENRRRGNSHGHHAHAVPAHRLRKPHHNHNNDDASDKHDHFRHQPHSENCGTDYHDELGFLRASIASDSPLLTLRKMFSAANSSCLGNYTYAEAVTHKRHTPSPPIKPSKVSRRSKPKKAIKPALSLNRQHLGRSYGHRGHHAQKDLNPVEGPEYDIVGPPSQQSHKHRHSSKGHNSNDSILPLSWFEEPTQTQQQHFSSIEAAPTVSELDASARRHLENRRRGNSDGHHARAVPAHRPRKPRHNHDNDDATDKHDHFRHQPHDENCGTDHHDELGNLHASAASDSPLLILRKMFSAANSSCLGNYTYAEAVSHKRHAHYPTYAVTVSAAPKTQRNNAATPEMNLGTLFSETEPILSQHSSDHHASHEHHGRSFGHHGHHPQHDLNAVEGFDYDIEGYQHHPNDQDAHQQHQSIAAPKIVHKDEDVATPEINIDDWYPKHEPSQQGSDRGPREHHKRSFGHHGHHAQHDLNPVEAFDFDIEGYQHHPNEQEQKRTDGFNGYKFTPPALPQHGLRTRHSSTDLRQVDPLSQYRPAGEYRGPLSQHRPPLSSNSPQSRSHPPVSNLDIKPYEIRITLANIPSYHASGPSSAVPQEQQEQPISKKERKLARKLQRQSAHKLRKSQAKSSAVATPAPAPFKLHGAMDDDVYAEAVKEHSKHHAPYPDSLDNDRHHSLDSASASAPAQPEVCKKERKQALKHQRQADCKLRRKAHQKSSAPNVALTHVPQELSKKELKLALKHQRQTDRKLRRKAHQKSSAPTVAPTLDSQEPSKKERKLALKRLRLANRKLRKSQQKAPVPYKADGSLGDDVYAEAVKEHSMHHAPYPDSLDNHHHHQATLKTTSDNGKDIKDPNYGPGHLHISEYQKQLHHFDYEDRHHAQTNPSHPQPQPQRQKAAKASNTSASPSQEGYLKLSSKLFKQPLTEDYYAEDANTQNFPELEQFRQPAGKGHRERAGPAQ